MQASSGVLRRPVHENNDVIDFDATMGALPDALHRDPTPLTSTGNCCGLMWQLGEPRREGGAGRGGAWRGGVGWGGRRPWKNSWSEVKKLPASTRRLKSQVGR